MINSHYLDNETALTVEGATIGNINIDLVTILWYDSNMTGLLHRVIRLKPFNQRRKATPVVVEGKTTLKTHVSQKDAKTSKISNKKYTVTGGAR